MRQRNQPKDPYAAKRAALAKIERQRHRANPADEINLYRSPQGEMLARACKGKRVSGSYGG